jgi:Protein of unknown function (DUF3455)
MEDTEKEFTMLPSISTSRLAGAVAGKAIALALALPMLLPGVALAEHLPPPNVPGDIQVEAGNYPYLMGHATGTQNYTCQSTATGIAWTLVAPAAVLVDDKGKQIMTHYAGPTWQARDGSTVMGARMKGVTMDPTAIPWLLLRKTSTSMGPDGGDRLTSTTFIQRVNTTGGLAPATGCDAAHLGAAVNVPYEADYFFYRAAE